MNWIAELGPTGIVAIAILLLMSGGLVPNKLHKQRISDLQEHCDVAVRERDAWFKAYEAQVEVNREQSRQLSEAVALGRTTAQVLNALPSSSRTSDSVRPRLVVDSDE